MFKIFKNKIGKNRGFTLIELLVVISIIGFLSSVTLASLQTARDRAKKTAFRADMNQLVTALEMYRNDFGYYPDSTSGTSTINSSGVWSEFMGSLKFYLALQGKYITDLPKIIPPYVAGSVFYAGDSPGMNYECGDSIHPANKSPYIIIVKTTAGLNFDALYGAPGWINYGYRLNAEPLMDYPALCFSIAR